MKTLPSLLQSLALVVLLFCSKPTNAQINNICDAFGGLMNESKTAFNNIAGGRIESEKGVRLASTFCIDGAVSCYIDSDRFLPAWVGLYGEYATKEEALTKVKALQADFVACNPITDFARRETPFAGLPFYYLTENGEDGFYIYSAKLAVELGKGGKYNAVLRVPFYSRRVTYKLLTNEPATTAFATELNRMVKESKNGFKNIEGKKLSEEEDVTTYSTTFCVTGTRCKLIDDGAFERRCELLVANGLSEEDATKNFKVTANLLAGALGKNFVWTKSDDSALYFSELNAVSPEGSDTVELKEELGDDDNYKITIVVNGGLFTK